jgi:NAD(P)-dependent dehydrogenase (short-subunit alcohol dehydrogenase family)
MKKTHFAAFVALGAAAAVALKSARPRWAWKNFRHRVVLVTGGSRGLGLELARQLLDDGARVFICARDAKELADAKRLLVDVTTLQADVTVPEDVTRVVETVVSQAGRIDVLINNAGVIRVGPVESMELADYQLAMDTHYWASVHASLAALPSMRRHNQGRIVNIASIGGVVNPPHLLPYNASKAALIAFSEGLSAEVGHNIRVTTVCPGLMRTGSPLNADFKGDANAEFIWFAASDMTPGFSISARAAARKILKACLVGDRNVMFTLPAKLGSVFHALFPDLTVDLFSFVNRLLPASDSRVIRRGRETRGRINDVLQQQLRAVGDRQNQSPLNN